ncbi:MAG: DUF2332 domain-containing protein [Stellaceae bacterium]
MAEPVQAQISASYLRFGEQEARGRSPLYETLACGVARDLDIIGFLMTLPREKRQPNLLFAAVRHLFGTQLGWAEFRRTVVNNSDALRRLMLARSTQTNEPGRCATLLPVLAMLPQPLALIEVGASAGLCLLPDFYGYDYRGHMISRDLGPAPIFPCTAGARTPLPTGLPEIVWRAGLDLNPIDVSDPAEAAWLAALVWPEQADRQTRLDAAMKIAAAHRPRLVKGDLRRDLGPLAAAAPKGATLVIFHTAVLAYIRSPAERSEFMRSVMSLCDFWLANEAPHVLPDVAAGIEESAVDGRFLMSVNGAPVAWADPHGAWLDWIADPPGVRRGPV